MELTIDEALHKAIEAHKAGQLQEADRLYTAILKAQPKHPDANHNLGLLAVSVGKANEALPYLKTALEANPNIAQFWMTYIDVLIKLERNADAKILLGQAKSKGAKGDGFDKLEQRLKEADVALLKTNQIATAPQTKQPNIIDSLTLDRAISLAKQKAKDGYPEEAKRIYQDILEKFPKNKRASDGLKGLVGSPVGNASKGQEPPQAQMQALISLYSQGQLQQALREAGTLVQQFPKSAILFNFQGAVHEGLGQLDESIEAYNKALTIKPNYAEACYNMGIALKKQGKRAEAIEAYNKALTIKPDYAEAYNNVGVSLEEQGKMEEAIEVYNKALTIKPDYAEAYYNMGVALKEQGKLAEAIEAYNKALAIKPDNAEAYNNMGVTLDEQGKLAEAIEAYNKALAIEPDNAEAYSNTGNVLKEQGKLEDSINAYNKALAIEPDNDVAWNNIVFPLQSMKLQVSSQKELGSYYPIDTGSNRYEFNRTTLNYILNLGSVHAESTLEQALNASGNLESAIIHNPDYNGRNIGSKMPLTDKVVALVHWGRSGTGLLHSLIDDHPEVSTLPSIYLSEYFSHSIWERIISDGWSHMADRFMDIYDVLFDATSSVPVQTKSSKLVYDIGLKEGMASVGDKRDEVLRVNKELFHAELTRLMNFYDQLDALLFLKLVHKAYDSAIGHIHQKSLIFYHIHNPSAHTQLNFVGLGTKANWIMMVREPLQSCESWLRDTFRENDYAGVATKIRTMLFQIDNIIYHKQNSVGVCLEDLKERPRQTILALCNWMGIEETDSLYEMTAQGKKWWGDPASPDFAQDGMDPFGKTSINRKIGSIFSERDQYILQTLFYPFSVRFGYVKENAEQFKRDLQTIRPMLDEMFGFEKLIVERTQVDQEQFMKSGSSLYLRSGLIERWNVLQEFGTYPNMIKPLNI